VVVCFLDFSFALQLVDRTDAAYQPPPRLCFGVLQEGYPKIQRAPWLQEYRIQVAVPKLFLPTFLHDALGYRTQAMVSLPVLNPKTILNTGFDSYKLMEKHNDMRAMVRQMKFSVEQPGFFLLNVGETHYPYALPDEPPDRWPRIRGGARRLQALG